MSEIPGFSSVDQIKIETHSPTDTLPKALTASNGALPEPEASLTDPASSLRAAALLTLKSKRRKPAQVSTLPARPVPNGITLNYGDDEPTTSTSASMMDNSKKVAQDGDTREEGEISDEETPQPEATPAVTTTQSNIGTAKPMPNSDTPSAPVKTFAKPATAPIQQVSISTSPANMVPILSNPQAITLQRFPRPVDDCHARPGLASTQASFFSLSIT